MVRFRSANAEACFCSTFHSRHPVLLARQVADVDRLSGGRLILGLGMGADEAEYRQLGIPFEPVPQRQRQLEEAVQIVRGVSTNPAFTFSGSTGRAGRAAVGRVSVSGLVSADLF